MKKLKTVARFTSLVLRLPVIVLLVLAYPFFLTAVLIQDYFWVK